MIKVLESGHLGGGTQSVMSGQDRYQFAQDAQHNKLSSLDQWKRTEVVGHPAILCLIGSTAQVVVIMQVQLSLTRHLVKRAA